MHGSVIALLLLPLAAGVAGTALDRLGANPVEEFTHLTGEWALRCLLLSLAVTPVRRFSGAAIQPYRRSFGLLAYAYGVVHFSVYLVFDLAFDFSLLFEDVAERPYITVGFAALVGLTPLVVTSSRAWQARLGRRWVALHRLVYLVAILAIVHFWWFVKADHLGPALHAGLLAVLLGVRLLPRQPPADAGNRGWGAGLGHG